GPDIGLRKLVLAGSLVVEKDDAEPAFLVAQEGLPGPLTVDADRLRRERLVHRRRVAAGEPKRSLEPESDCAAVRELVARRGLEGMGEGVAEVQGVPRSAVVGITETERRLVRSAPPDELLVRKIPELFTGEETRFHH